MINKEGSRRRSPVLPVLLIIGGTGPPLTYDPAWPMINAGGE